MSTRKYVVTCIVEIDVEDGEQLSTASGFDDELNSLLANLGFRGEIFVMGCPE